MGSSDDGVGNKELVPSDSSSGNGSKNKRKYLSESLSDEVNTLSESLSDEVNTFSEPLSGKVNAFSEPLSDKVNTLAEPLPDKVNTLSESLPDKVNTLSESLSDKVNPLSESHSDKVNNTLTESLSDKFNTLSVTETSGCELLKEHLQKSSNEVELQKPSESDNVEHDLNEWAAPVVCEILFLLSENLHRTFERAIVKLVDLGYNKDIAEQTFLRCGLYHSTKDTASNAVEGALFFMNREKELETSGRDIFSDLNNLVDYTLLEMVSVLKEISPCITVAESLWILLVCDLNLLHACVVNGNHLSNVTVQDVFEEVSFDTVPSKLKPEVFEPIYAFLKNVHFSKSIALSSQSSDSEDLTAEAAVKGNESSVSIGKSAGARKEYSLNVSEGPTAEEKSAVCQKSSLSGSEREMLRQKPFHMEAIRGGFTKKVPCCGMGLDKAPKFPSSSSGIPVESTFSEVSPCVGYSNVSNVSLSVPQVADDVPSAMDSKGSVFRVPAPKAKTPPSLTLSLGPTSKTGGYISGSSEESDHCAGIPYDESPGEFIPQDEVGNSIVTTLVSHMKAMQNEVHGWNEWAKEKIVQATQRLFKDQGEIRMLRQEAERLKNEKQGPEDSSLKRISEIENAINNAGDQLLIINATVWSLDKGNSELRTKLEAAKERASGAATNLKEALQKEQELFKRTQTIDREKIFLKEELTALKHVAEDMRCQLERTEERTTQLEVVLNQEKREKETYRAQAQDIRRQTEQQQAKLKGEEDCMRETAASKSQSRDQHIKKLTDEVSQWNLSYRHPKISQFLGGSDVNYGGRSAESKLFSVWLQPPGDTVDKRATVPKGSFEVGLKPQRECVMCLSEEMAVLFFPCAHQVLCEECNALHEKKGMKDCPSCRTSIQERINVRFQGF